MRASSSIRYSPTRAACQLVPQAVSMMRLTAAKLLRREVQAAELGGGVLVVQAAAHRVFERFGLLEDLLEHVVRKAAQLDVGRFDRQVVDAGARCGPCSRCVTSQRVGGDQGDLMIGQIDDLVGAAGQRRGVAGDEVLAVADADDQRAALPGGDDQRRDSRGTGSPGHRCRGACDSAVLTAASSSACGSSAGNSSRVLCEFLQASGRSGGR